MGNFCNCIECVGDHPEPTSGEVLSALLAERAAHEETKRQNTELVKLLAMMREALKTYQCAGFGNSIDIVLHSIAYRLGTEALSATPETVEKYLDEVRADERKLRRMLCACYAGVAAYMDDGEAQDSRQMPIIDFMRFTPEQIEQAMLERAMAELRAKKGGE